jgi:thiamine-phosphate pyrophosphorylase
MRPRHPVPRLWLMTDERLGDALWPAIDALPRGTGIIFRHYRTPARERRALFDRVRARARARALVVVLAGPARLAVAWRADGVHGRGTARSARPLLRTAPAHDRREIVAAMRGGADLILVSPLFATRSHPGAPTLGRVRFGLMIRGAGRVAALGGMDAERFCRLRGLGVYGWAAIDAWSRAGTDQKRKAVPT